MRPVSHPTMPSGTVSCQTTPADCHRRLLDEWTEWASSAPPGNGECRDMALESLKYCLENKTDQLDLSDFNLTTLPENWPASLRELDVSSNGLTCLPEALPASLQSLDVGFNQLTALPERLPASLRWLYAFSNQLTALSVTLPTSLELLDVSSNQLTACPERLPLSLQELNVSDNNLISLLEALPASLQSLDAGYNRLITLPAMLPASLEWLDISHNRLTSLPAMLPASLESLNIAYNGLTSLPATLPVSLTFLNIDHNQVTMLPAMLPSSIYQLDAAGNRLTALPERLPTSLRCLHVSHNELTSLPERLPDQLEILSVDHNQLTSLPEALPASLQRLGISNNRLTALPALLPTSLQRLDISHNRFISLPVSVTESVYELDVRGNPLAVPVSGLSTDLLDTIEDWTDEDDASQWQKIQSEDGAVVFADFLHKLHEGKNKLSAALHGRVREWLSYLGAEESGELRKQTFLVAEEAVTSCVDRAAFYFNKMYWLMTEDRAIKSGATAEHLIATIRSGFRLQVLGRIASAHVQRLRREAAGFVEEIEIYLAYQYRLREPLSLPVYTELQFTELARLTEEEIAQAGAAVLRQEQTDFLRYLVTESTAWRQRLQSWDSEKTAAVEASYLEAIASADFSEAVERELKENGLPADDSDARRAVCKQRADTLLFEKRYQLTREYLTAHKALPCLAPFLG